MWSYYTPFCNLLLFNTVSVRFTRIESWSSGSFVFNGYTYCHNWCNHNLCINSALELLSCIQFFLTFSNNFARTIPARVSLCEDFLDTWNACMRLYESPTRSSKWFYQSVLSSSACELMLLPCSSSALEISGLPHFCKCDVCMIAPRRSHFAFPWLAERGARFQVSVGYSVFLFCERLLPTLWLFFCRVHGIN